MKKILSFVMVVLTMLLTSSCTSKETSVKVPTYDQFLEIVKQSWDNELSDDNAILTELGMKKLVYDTIDEGEFVSTYAYYGINASIEKTMNDGWPSYTIKKENEHVIVIDICLTTDNSETISFSDEADFNTFKASIPENNDFGTLWFDRDEENGFFYVTLHAS